jgi:hypothetical protein
MPVLNEPRKISPKPSVTYDVIFFVALMATALALGAALAHAYALPNKIVLPDNEYFIAQKAYRGWNRLGFLLAVELVSMVALAVMSWGNSRVFRPVIAAIVFLLCAQALFWIFTFPANVATQNWTVVPDNWEALRRQWEYSHAAGAVFQLLAMSALAVAALARRRP